MDDTRDVVIIMFTCRYFVPKPGGNINKLCGVLSACGG